MKKSNSDVRDLNEAEFHEIIKDDKLTIVDFWAPWCGPCRAMMTIMDEIKQKNPDCNVVKLNIENEKRIASVLGIRAIPTLIAFKNGNEIGRHIGSSSKFKIQDFVESFK